MFENQQICFANVFALQPCGTLSIGKYIFASDHADALGQLVALPPTIEQCRDPACHQDGHIGDDPVGRVAGCYAHTLADLKSMAFTHPPCQCTSRCVAFCKCESKIAVDQKLLVAVERAEHVEIVAQICWSLRNHRDLHAIFLDMRN